MTPTDRLLIILSDQRNRALDTVAGLTAERDELAQRAAYLSQYEPKPEAEKRGRGRPRKGTSNA